MNTGRQKRNGEIEKGRKGEKISPVPRFTDSPIHLICCILLTTYCLLLTSGCQKESTPPQPPAPEVKKEAPKPTPLPPAAEVKEEDKEKEEVAIDVRQRNPFKPFIMKMTERPAVVTPKTPLQKYEVEQLKLIAIIWGMDTSVAMVETPDGKGYSIRKGDFIGNRDGRVKRIEKNRVIIEERLTETGGEVLTNELVIQLPLGKGEEELQ